MKKIACSLAILLFPLMLSAQCALSDKYYDASRRYRKNAMEGKLSSGDAPDNPKYSNRNSL